jgi:hypothetical protein
MYLLTFEAVPTQEHDAFDTVEGAFINAWIPADHAEGLDEAEAMARNHIAACHWFVKKLDRSSLIDEDDFEPHDVDSEYYQLARSGEQAYVFNTYPHEDEN